MRGGLVWGQPQCYGEGPQTCLSPPLPQTAPHKHSQPAPRPRGVAQGAVLSCPRHPDWPCEPGKHLSGSVHFGVVNEMSCQTDGLGVGVGRQSERMNCSLRKLRVPPFFPMRARGAEVRGRVLQHLHPYLCGPTARGAGEPDSRLPIFSFAAQGLLFVLYIRPQREQALSPARRQPLSGGEGSKP